jgi:hypothetical protein
VTKLIVTVRSFANAPKNFCFHVSKVGCRSVLCSYCTFVRPRTFYINIICSEVHIRFSEIIQENNFTFRKRKVYGTY